MSFGAILARSGLCRRASQPGGGVLTLTLVSFPPFFLLTRVPFSDELGPSAFRGTPSGTRAPILSSLSGAPVDCGCAVLFLCAFVHIYREDPDSRSLSLSLSL